MFPALMMCAILIDQADVTYQEPAAVILEVDDDDGIVDDAEDDYYCHVDLQCGHDKVMDCVDAEWGEYWECTECGYIEWYNIWYGHVCEYELVYSGDDEYDMICKICGDAHKYIPTDEEWEEYWAQYDESEREEEN